MHCGSCVSAFSGLTRPTVLNVISLEFSETPLAQYVQSPTIVRQLDWIDLFWPLDRKQRLKQYPQVRAVAVAAPAVSSSPTQVLLAQRSKPLSVPYMSSCRFNTTV